MHQELIDGTKQAAKDELCAMIDENWDAVVAAYQKAYAESELDPKFKFTVGAGVEMH